MLHSVRLVMKGFYAFVLFSFLTMWIRNLSYSTSVFVSCRAKILCKLHLKVYATGSMCICCTINTLHRKCRIRKTSLTLHNQRGCFFFSFFKAKVNLSFLSELHFYVRYLVVHRKSKVRALHISLSPIDHHIFWLFFPVHFVVYWFL